jgi:probable phosphoglycerate mutase
LTKILLVRHGDVEGIKPERFRGRAELPLTHRGVSEANAVARRIAAVNRRGVPTPIGTLSH